jgi:hypothetical protein
VSPLVIDKGTTLATAASVIRESSGEVLSAAANPLITIEPGSMFRGAEVTVQVGNLTVEVTLSGADRLSLVEILLGRRITESEARALDGDR